MTESLIRIGTNVRFRGPGIANLDAEARIRNANIHFRQLTGYSLEELKRLNLPGLVDPGDSAAFADLLGKLASGEINSFTMPLRLQQKDAQTAWVMLSVSSYGEGESNPRETVCVIVDIEQLKANQASLEENVIRMRLATGAARIGTWDWNLLDDTVAFSPEWKAQLGYTDLEITNSYEEWENRLHPDDREWALKRVRDYIDGKLTNYELEFRLRHKDGSYRWIRARAERITDEAGRTIRLFGCHVDITETRDGEEALRSSEEKFRLLIKQSPIAIHIHAPDGRFVDSNPAFLKLYGLTEEMLPELYAHYNILHDTQAEKVGLREDTLRMFAGEKVIFPVVRYNTAETLEALGLKSPVARNCWVRGLGFPLKDNSGKVIAGVILSEDITEQQMVLEALRASEAKFRAIMEQSPLSIQIINTRGRIENVNKAWKALWGVPDEVLPGILESYSIFEDPELKERGFITYVRRIFNGEQITLPLMEYDRTRSFEGVGSSPIRANKRWVHVSGYPVSDAKGRVINIVNIEEDVTEKILAQQRLEAQQERLHALAAEIVHTEEQERRRIATDLHDGAAQSLAFARMELATLIKTIPNWDGAEKLSNISQLLRMSIQQIREVLLHLSSPSLNEIGLAAAISEWMEIQAGQHGNIQFSLMDRTEDIELSRDIRTMLFRNTRELLMNVIKHADATMVEVDLDISGKDLVITVKDNGKGLDPNEKLKSPERGQSFGLFSIRENMHDIGGSLELNSTPGQGTLAALRLPLAQNREEI